MKTSTALCLLLSLNGLLVDGAAGDVLLELIGPSELTIEQGFPHSPTQPFPVNGESLLVSALITNDSSEPFEALVVGETAVGTGNTALLAEVGSLFLDTFILRNDPLFITPEGNLGITLKPHEVFIVPVMELWGVKVGGTPLFSPGVIGSRMSITELTIEMLSGLDSDPDLAPADTFLTLDRTFTVTLVPEPTTLLLLGVPAICILTRRTHYGRKTFYTA